MEPVDLDHQVLPVDLVLMVDLEHPDLKETLELLGYLVLKV